MKIVFLVISSESETYSKLESKIRETWKSNLDSKDCPVYFCYGNSLEFSVEGDKIYCPFEENLMNIGHKTIRSLEYLLENVDFDLVYRTNSSSYIDLENMYKYLNCYSLENFYSGYINLDKKSNILFCSGSGYFLSRDVVKMVIENKNDWDHSLIDDVSMGKLLKNLGITMTQGRRLDINQIKDSGIFFNEKPIENIQIDNSYHFRCKTNDPSREEDCKIMEYLYKTINK
jgi:hypothetical protein